MACPFMLSATGSFVHFVFCAIPFTYTLCSLSYSISVFFFFPLPLVDPLSFSFPLSFFRLCILVSSYYIHLFAQLFFALSYIFLFSFFIFQMRVHMHLASPSYLFIFSFSFIPIIPSLPTSSTIPFLLDPSPSSFFCSALFLSFLAYVSVSCAHLFRAPCVV